MFRSNRIARWLPACAGLVLVLCGPPLARAQWKAGIGKADITPSGSIWMAGYAARKKPSEGVRRHLFVKALALQEDSGQTSVLVTLDLVSIKREVAKIVAEKCRRQFGLTRERLVLNASHTHSGPVTGTAPSYASLDAAQTETVRKYTEGLIEKIVAAVGDSIQDLAPATLAFEQGLAGIAVNRRRVRLRSLPGPVDHDVPVLSVRAPDGRLRAVVVGYACHATALGDYQISADWPGFAKEAIEKAHPGTEALFVQGCGADANPLPRYQGTDPALLHYSVELAESYGKVLAAAVDVVLAAKMKPVGGPLRAAFDVVDIPIRVAAGEHRPERYPYPVQVWRFGSGLKFLALGGEVVVDYSLRLKAQYGWDDTWVAGYSNDVFGYIPSLRVLKEGGYEGGDANKSLGGPFGAAVEEIIVEKVGDLMARTSAQ